MAATRLPHARTTDAQRFSDTARRDLLAIVVISALTCVVSFRFGAFDHLAVWSQANANKGLKEFLFVPVIAGLAFAAFAYRRWRELQRQIRTAENANGEMRAILDATNEAILLVGSDHCLHTTNRRFETLFGVSALEFLGRDIDVLHARAESFFADTETFRALVAGETRTAVHHYRTTVTQKWPERRDLDVYVAPLPGADGTTMGRLYAFRDVTRERAADRAKDEFISVVSHELRTPLTSIKGYLDLVLNGDAGEVPVEQREFLDVVAQNTERLIAIVNDLLDLSQLEGDGIALQHTSVDLAAVIAQAVQSLRLQIEGKRQHLEMNVPPDLPTVSGDTRRLLQVLTNLLSNAHKYTPDGGGIYITAAMEDDRVRIEVRDTGIGMTISEQERLFTRFYRAKNPAALEVGGTGLGLVITKKLVTLHGGEISVASTPGIGSTFSVRLPLVRSGVATGDGGAA
jgi:PAS domain S-box-containing protein